MTSSMPELPSSVRSLWRSLRLGYQAEPLLLVVTAVTTVLAAAPDALFAVGLKLLTEAVVDRDRTLIAGAAVLLAALAAGSWLLNTLGDRVNLRLAERSAVYIEAHVARLQASVATIEHHERADILDRLSVLRDHADALSQLYRSLFQTAGAAVRLVLTVVLLMSVHPLLGLLAVFATPTVLVANRRAAREKEVEERGAQHRRLARHLFLVGSAPASGKEVRTARVQERIQRDRDAAWLRGYAPMARARLWTAVWQSAAWVLLTTALLASVAYIVWSRRSSAGDVALVLAAGSRLSQYIGQTVTETHFLRTIWLDVSRRMVWLEDFVRSRRGTADLPVPERITSGIAFENVTFTYPGASRPALQDVSLVLPAGQVVAVVGENGAGKTTLVKLIARYYDPSAGRVCVDGVPLNRIPPDGWRQRLSGAFQDFFRFEYRAQRSIGVGDRHRLDERPVVESALVRAGAGDVVDGLADGLDTQLGATWPNGVELSFGQWQKIALARAYMRANPLVLLLDEPTAALDAETEHALFESYAAAARSARGRELGQITVLVSHRFSTIRMADLIVVLDGARMLESGSHDELIALNGRYAELYGIQAAGYR